MSPEDRDSVTRSIANLWTLQAMVLSRLMGALREEGLLSSEQIDWHLQQIDNDVDVLDGEDDQQYATQMLATVRARLGLRR